MPDKTSKANATSGDGAKRDGNGKSPRNAAHPPNGDSAAKTPGGKKAHVKNIQIPLPEKDRIDKAAKVAAKPPCAEKIKTKKAEKNDNGGELHPVKTGFVMDMRRKLYREIFERCLLKRMKNGDDAWPNE